MDGAEPSGAYRLERTVMLTDAVVAIAMTLLVLPLVELAPELDPERLGASLSDHGSAFLGFGISFVTIFFFWSAHARAFAEIRAAGPALRVLTLLWLLGIAFLPFPTAVIGREPTTSSAPFYIGSLAVLSAITAATTWLAARSAREPETNRRLRWRAATWWVSTAVFALCAAVSSLHPDLGLLGLLLHIPVWVVGRRVFRSRAAAGTEAAGAEGAPAGAVEPPGSLADAVPAQDAAGAGPTG